jgi:hypothetical protein
VDVKFASITEIYSGTERQLMDDNARYRSGIVLQPAIREGTADGKQVPPVREPKREIATPAAA